VPDSELNGAKKRWQTHGRSYDMDIELVVRTGVCKYVRPRVVAQETRVGAFLPAAHMGHVAGAGCSRRWQPAMVVLRSNRRRQFQRAGSDVAIAI